MKRIFREQGADFFERNEGRVLEDEFLDTLAMKAPADDIKEMADASLTQEELMKLRVELYEKLR